MTTTAIATRAACGPAVLLLSSVYRRDSGPGKSDNIRRRLRTSAGLRQRPVAEARLQAQRPCMHLCHVVSSPLCACGGSRPRDLLRFLASIPTGVLILHGPRRCESEFGANSSVLKRRGSAEFCRTGVCCVLNLLNSLSSLSLKWAPARVPNRLPASHSRLSPHFSGYTAACRTANCGATRCPVCRGFHVRRAPCSGPLITHREAVSCVNTVASSLK